MSSRSTRIALLRGINVGGRNKILMAELRSACKDLGWDSVETYIQTGNVVFSSDESTSLLETRLEEVIESRFGFFIPVVARDSQDFERILAASPFCEEAESDPSHVILYLCKDSVHGKAQEVLQGKAIAGEQVRADKDALWIYFANGVGRSKLTPAIIDKAVGSPATGRNWKTALKIRELASQ